MIKSMDKGPFAGQMESNMLAPGPMESSMALEFM